MRQDYPAALATARTQHFPRSRAYRIRARVRTGLVPERSWKCCIAQSTFGSVQLFSLRRPRTPARPRAQWHAAPCAGARALPKLAPEPSLRWATTDDDDDEE